MRLLTKSHQIKDRLIKREFIFAHTTIVLLALCFSAFIVIFRYLIIDTGDLLINLLNIMLGLLLFTAFLSAAIIVRVLTFKK